MFLLKLCVFPTAQSWRFARNIRQGRGGLPLGVPGKTPSERPLTV
jgi:hypothetical protein